MESMLESASNHQQCLCCGPQHTKFALVLLVLWKHDMLQQGNPLVAMLGVYTATAVLPPVCALLMYSVLQPTTPSSCCKLST